MDIFGLIWGIPFLMLLLDCSFIYENTAGLAGRRDDQTPDAWQRQVADYRHRKATGQLTPNEASVIKRRKRRPLLLAAIVSGLAAAYFKAQMT
jgi:hypothetical protein